MSCNQYPHLVGEFKTRQDAYHSAYVNGFKPVTANRDLWQRTVWINNQRRTQNRTIIKDGDVYRVDTCKPY